MMNLRQKSVSGKLILFSSALFVLALTEPIWAQPESLPLFGPDRFTKEIGAPETFSRVFAACNAAAIYRLVVENGSAGTDRLSSATINLNGVDVVQPSDLNQRVERVEKEVSLQGENTLVLRLAGNPDGFITVSLYCALGCLDIDWTSPAEGSTVSRARELVQGNLLNVPGEVGVILTSVGAEGEASELAQVQGNLFAGLVPLQAGENTLTATATDACGYQTRKGVVVHADSVLEKVSLTALPDSGILAASGTFDAALEADAYLSAPIARYVWDLDGDGTSEQSGADLSKMVAQYKQPGIYFPRVTVTDTLGASYWETAVINVLTREEMDALLKAKWDKMREGLKRGDVEQALKLFSNDTKDRYRGILAALKEKLSGIAGGMQDIQLIYLKDGRAKYRIRRQEETGEATYYIYFVRDEDGMWKIERF